MKCIDKECICREPNGGDKISDYYYCKYVGIEIGDGTDECLLDEYDSE